MFGTFAITMIVYNSSTLALFYEMYYYHRLAFHKHVKQLVALFIATEITLLSILAGQGQVIFDEVCYVTEAQLDMTFHGICR
mmetsp:Transcript_30295/g.35527  ORF Transcript_30295/g.35527 Transcript_30295/m.35527 type:complete len:82 (+) Transcript_30295:45-290(+)